VSTETRKTPRVNAIKRTPIDDRMARIYGLIHTGDKDDIFYVAYPNEYEEERKKESIDKYLKCYILSL
jgi:hypothetical protein